MWSTIIGHKKQIDQVKKALESGRLPNAYLFTGPRGIGKRKVADLLAMTIVCRDAPSKGWEPCGVCPGCRKAIAGTHPDVFVVEPEAEQKIRDPSTTLPPNDRRAGRAGARPEGRQPDGDAAPSKRKPSENIRIEQLRDLQSRVRFHTFEAPAKIAILDDADRMTAAAANSLLKVLEEPPAVTHFVLISTLPHLILPTIRSRCSHLPFGPLPDQDIARVIRESGGVAKDDVMWVARLSGGCLGTALAIDPLFAKGVVGRFLSLIGRASSADVIEAAEDWSRSDAKQVRLVFDLLASFYRDVLKLHTTGDEAGVINPEAARQVASVSAKVAEHALAKIAQARTEFDTTANKQLMFENLLFSLTG